MSPINGNDNGTIFGVVSRNANGESIIKIRCKMPTLYHLLYIVVIGLLGASVLASIILTIIGLLPFYAILIYLIATGIAFAVYSIHKYLIRKCFASITKNKIEGVNATLFKRKHYTYPISDIMEVEEHNFLGVNKIVIAVKPKNECGLYLRTIYRPSTITMGGNKIVFYHVIFSYKVRKSIIELFNKE